jgi:hypothetical protein
MDIEAWKVARNTALRTLDLAWASRRLDSDDTATLLAALHKARYECTELEDALRHESAAWLRERGLKGLGGLPLLPPGELPRLPKENPG